MAVNPNEDTEFNDILRKHGVLPPKEPEPKEPSPPPPPTLDERLDDLTVDELRELEEDADDETERIIESIRKQRLAEMRQIQKARFGRVYPIGRDDYTREVTEASKIDEDGSMGTETTGKGTGVVCFLYKDGIARCDRAHEHVRILAQRHPRTKFVSIVGDKCIPNLPDTRVPMFIIYRNGEVLNQIVAWGADRERKIEELEAVLILAGAIIPVKLNSVERKRSESSDEEDEQSDDSASRRRSAATRTNGKAPKNIRSKRKEYDDDSDFDL